jgi:hypothetical protein
VAKHRRCLLVAAGLAYYASALAQSISVGSLGASSGFFGFGPITVIDRGFPATGDGVLTSAAFRWSAAPCPAAAKIKIFTQSSFLYHHQMYLDAERGPFDVLQTTQTVDLTPPIAVRKGDLIAVTGLSGCGGPLGNPSGTSFVLNGDADGFSCDIRFANTCPPFTTGYPAVQAVGGRPERVPRVVPFRK